MKPIAPLMIEHRLFDRMIVLMRGEVSGMREGRVNAGFVDRVLDFFMTYVDRCHHGKEEDILFRALGDKEMSLEHKVLVEELLKEHAIGRNIIERLAGAKERFDRGDSGSVKDMSGEIEEMLALYPSHIEKEDKRLFLPSMEYFSPEEQERMLAEMSEFDRRLIHDVYRDMVERLELERR